MNCVHQNQLNLVEASVHPIGAVGLWNSMIKIIKMAKEKGDDIIVICEDDHYFTENYSPKLLFKEVTEAYIQGAEVLSGGIGGFGQAIPAGYHRYKVDSNSSLLSNSLIICCLRSTLSFMLIT